MKIDKSMKNLKALTLIIAAVVLGGCGDSKDDEVDGSSASALENSLAGLKQSLPYDQRQVVEADLKSLSTKYKDKTELAKLLDGKDAAGIHAEADKSRKFFLDMARANQVERFQTLIDQANAKIAGLEETMGKEKAESSGYLDESKARIVKFQAEIDGIKAMSDEQIAKKYGCAGGC